MNKKKITTLFLGCSVFVFTAVLFQNLTPSSIMKTCSAADISRLLDSSIKETVSLRCSLRLDPENLIVKRLVIQGATASGVTLDCNGATLSGGENDGDSLVIRSQKITNKVTGEVTWSRPENIVIKNCKIKGSVRIWGLGKNGEADDVRESSRQDGNHTARAQASAPTKILFSNVSITGTGRIPLYISPGVTYFTLQNSRVRGESKSVGIYFDAESGFNTLINNTIAVDTESRELVAIDASANNTIVGNHFSSLSHGGIFLYRNCGEGGTVRHQSPVSNKILSNYFHYADYSGLNPSILIASRNGNRSYCAEDSGFLWGSSTSNLDFARNNVIADNKIAKRSVASMIISHDSPNMIVGNSTVAKYSQNGYSCFYDPTLRLMRHAESFVDKVTSSCQAITVSCNNGVIQKSVKILCQNPQNDDDPVIEDPADDKEEVKKVSIVNAECSANSNNAGCFKQVACMAGKKILNVRAACHLEAASVHQSAVEALPWGTLSVLRSSDHVSEGRCLVEKNSIQQGSTVITSVVNKNSINIGCKEHDKNGGDCKILVQMQCQ